MNTSAKTHIRKSLAVLLAALMLVCYIPLAGIGDFAPTAYAASTWSGSWTDSNGYSSNGSTVTISSANGFAYFVNQVSNNGNTYSGTTVNLTTDIDLAGKDWNPSGSGSFQGTFDGQNHTVSGLYFNLSSTDRGLIPKASNNAVIKNITISSPNVSSSNCSIGAVTGWANTGHVTFENCHVNGGSVSAGKYVGAICGATDGYVTMTNCSSTANVTSGGEQVGGLIGRVYSDNNNTFVNCTVGSSSSYVTIKGDKKVGGIVGTYEYNQTLTFTNCKVYAHVTATGSGGYAGGIIGYHKGHGEWNGDYFYGDVHSTAGADAGGLSAYIQDDENNFYDCHVNASVIEAKSCVGGFVGYQGGDNVFIVKNSSVYISQYIKGGDTAAGVWGRHYGGIDFSNITVSGASGAYIQSTGSDGAGIVAYNDDDVTSIINCSNTLNVTASARAGGILGYGGDSDGDRLYTVKNCTNRGNIKSTGSDAGGIIGALDTDNQSHVVTNNTNYGNVEVTGGSSKHAGGIVGWTKGGGDYSYNTNYGSYVKNSSRDSGGIVGDLEDDPATFNYCINYANIEGPYATGGIVGYVGGGKEAQFYRCFNYGDVTSTAGDSNAGGIYGACNWSNSTYGDVNECYSIGAVRGGGDTGGLIGSGNWSSVHSSFNWGSVAKRTSDKSYSFGGIAGVDVVVYNTYNTGSVTYGDYAAGIVAYKPGSATNSYNTGAISGANNNRQIYGHTDISQTNCYYLSGVSGDGQGTGKSQSDLRASNMPGQLNGDVFCQDTWGVNQYYPIHKWFRDNYFYFTIRYNNGSTVISEARKLYANTATNPSATKTGYTLKGWYTAATGGTKVGNAGDKVTAGVTTPMTTTSLSWAEKKVTMEGTVNYYAQWTPNNYTVTFNTQGADISSGTTSATVTYDAKPATITPPQKTGYTFIGYYTGADAQGTQYYNATGEATRNWNIASDTTLYAAYTINSYNITFVNYDGTQLYSLRFTYGTTPAYSGATPTKPYDENNHYAFSGWTPAITAVGTSAATYTATYTATAHSYTGTVSTKATCTKAGTTKYTCSCGYSYTDNTTPAATGHTAGAAATCTTAQVCTICGTEITAAAGHTPTVTNAKDATCTADGTLGYVYCAVCGKYFTDSTYATETTVADRVVTATGHSYKTTVVAPDCKNVGYTIHTCTKCGDTYNDTVTLALGHDFVAGEIITAPTCKATGTQKYECSRCDASEIRTAPIDPTAHVAGETVEENHCAATCVLIGSYEEVVYCSLCNEEISRTLKKTPALGHTYTYTAHCDKPDEIPEEYIEYIKDDLEEYIDSILEGTGKYPEYIYYHIAECSVCHEKDAELCDEFIAPEDITFVPATCGAYGYATATCTLCGNVLTATKESDPPTGAHSFTNYVPDNNAKCTEDGTKTAKCDNCDATDTIADEGTALGHDYKEVENSATAPSCTAAGKKADKKCSRCDDVITGEEIAVLSHTAGDTVIENEVAATCEEDGAYDEVVYCTVCENEISREKKTVTKLAHTVVVTGKVEATCTTDGYTGDTVCDVCGTEIAKGEVTTKLGHAFGEYVSNNDATCEADGTKTAACSRCDATDTVTDEGTKLPHTEKVTGKVEATCTTDGYTGDTVCDVCGTEIAKGEVTTKLGHAFGEYVSNNDATCTADGTKTAECSRCDATDTVDDEGTALGHSFTSYVSNNDATCTADGTKTAICDRCTATDTVADENSALGHSFTNYVSNDDATCTSDGTKTATCDRCTATDTVADENSALGHSFTSYVSDGNATCTEDGTKTATCDRCTETDTVADENSALGHSFTSYVSDGNATCTADGTKTAKCDRCTETDTVTDIGSKLAHTPAEAVKENEVAATCTQDGTYDAVVYCTECGAKLSSESKTITKLGHNYQTVANSAVAPTCITAGKEADVECANCSDIITGTEIAATGRHNYIIVVSNEIPADCGSDGTTAMYMCETCDATTGGEVIPSTGDHSFTVLVTAKVPATCITDGTTAVYRCSGCTATKGGDVIAATGIHSYTVKTADEIPASCTTEGTTAIYKCATCDATTGGETIEKLAHTLSEVGAENATCITAGHIGYFKCNVCENMFTDNTAQTVLTEAEIVIPATETHAYTEKVADEIPASCTTEGKTAIYKCANCDETTGGEIIEKAAHTEETIPAVAATCTKTGLTAGVKCSVCGEILTAQTTTEKAPHTEETIPAVDATCTKTGLTAGVKCSVCGEILTAQTVTEKAAHTEKEIPAVAATCTKTGLTAGVKCSVCGEILTAQTTTEKAPHTEKEITAVAATCTKTGLTAGVKCSVCGEILTAQTVTEKVAHTEEAIPAVAATCTTAGATAGTKCSVCGTVIVAPVTVNATGHSYAVVSGTEKAATCTTEGKLADEKCTVCGDVKTGAVTEKLAHTEETIPAVDATCTQTGLTAGKKCTVCGTVTVAQKPVAKKGHTFTDWTVVKEATETETGLETRSCTVCGTEETKEIPVILQGQRTIKFINSAHMHYVVGEKYVIYNSSAVKANANSAVTFTVVTYDNFGYEAYVVYLNNERIEPDENGVYTIPAGDKLVIVTVAGASVETNPDDDTTTTVSFWEWLIRLFRKIASLFKGSRG